MEERLVWRVIPAKGAVMMQQVSQDGEEGDGAREASGDGKGEEKSGNREWKRASILSIVRSKLQRRGRLRRRWGNAQHLLI